MLVLVYLDQLLVANWDRVDASDFKQLVIGGHSGKTLYGGACQGLLVRLKRVVVDKDHKLRSVVILLIRLVHIHAFRIC